MAVLKRNWEAAVFVFACAVGLFLGMDYARPRVALAATNNITTKAFGAEVTVTTANVEVVVPGGRSGAFMFNVPSSETGSVYVLFGQQGRPRPVKASSSAYDLKIDPGQSFTVNFHETGVFAYSGTGSTAFEYLVTYR